MRFRSISFFMLAIVFAIGLYGFTDQAWGASARSKYMEGDACYQKLKKNAKKRRYRSNWMTCIDKFQSSYAHRPSGPWAPAALYMTAKLFEEMYAVSQRAGDRSEARDRFERVVRRFPKSAYKGRAVAELKRIGRKPKTSTASTKPASDKKRKKPKTKKVAPAKKTESPRALYDAADKCYRRLKNDPTRMQYRKRWNQCIDAYYAVHRVEPDGKWSAAGLFRAAEVTGELYRTKKVFDDWYSARSLYEKIIDEHPKSRYSRRAATALVTLGRIKPAGPDPTTVVKAPPETTSAGSSSSGTGPKEADPVDLTGGPAMISNLRYWSNPHYTRVVIDASKKTDYTYRLLKPDPALKTPPRLYVDFAYSRLGQTVQKQIPINDNLLINARAGQYTINKVRVVVDIKSFKTYKIFSLKDPFRLVIDVWGDKEEKQRPSVAAPQLPKGNEKIDPGALAKQLALGVRRIVIDPGHGGKDYGAPGYLKGVHEKYVVLQLSKILARKLREQLGVEVSLTRTRDRYLSLEERTAIANTRSADLFVSVHTNAARDRRAHGLETYFLNLATDEEAIRVAAMENATSTKNISDLQSILSDLMKNVKINESARLADHVQRETYGHLKRYYKPIKNKGVKQAPFYVLLGARMPAILVETGFISNPRECRRLINPKYQERVADGIIRGIKGYIRSVSPTALGPVKVNGQTG